MGLIYLSYYTKLLFDIFLLINFFLVAKASRSKSRLCFTLQSLPYEYVNVISTSNYYNVTEVFTFESFLSYTHNRVDHPT